MFWVCETEEQLNRLFYNKECYVNVIPLNHNYHPLLTSPSFIYYKCLEEKGFIFPINHNDGFSVDLNLIKKFLLKHPKIYCLNKKNLIYWLGEEFNDDKIIDINYIHLETNLHKLEIPDFKQTVAKYLESSFKSNSKLNSFIPLTKHYEEQEYIFNYIKEYIGKNIECSWYNGKYTYYTYLIERNGIFLEENDFKNNFILKYPKLSIKNNKIYTYYNNYNFTGRLTNSFNGINFSALKKEGDYRKCFIPQNDFFFEFDYSSFHLYLSAKLINYKFKEKDVHSYLGKLYFNKEELTAEEYQESKFISFQQMYGNIKKKYENLEFFSRLKIFIQELWEKTNELGYLELKTGRKIYIKHIDNPTPSKIFNYLIQSLESWYIINAIDKILPLFNNKKSKIVLITYDSILIDYSKEDGKNLLKEILNKIKLTEFQIKSSYGTNYKELKKL